VDQHCKEYSFERIFDSNEENEYMAVTRKLTYTVSEQDT